jgi:YHS domain-containing protein
MRAQFLSLAFCTVAFGAICSAYASNESGSQFATVDGLLALGGLSPVELVDTGATVQGDLKFSTTYLGYIYQFPNAASKAKFDANREKYNVHLYGYCPVSLAAKQTLKGDPAIFSVFDNRLFIFKDGPAKAMFDRDPSQYVARQGDAVPVTRYVREAG